MFEPIFYPAQAFGNELEFRVIEQAFLQARDEPEFDQPADLAKLAQETEVEYEVVLFAGPKVIEQFVNDEQHAVVGIFFVELSHHGGQIVLVAVHLIVCREGEG